MKANELRIGNYVFYEAPINDGCVEAHSIKILTHRIDINGRPQSYYKPIPLTEEILLKCGFIKDENEMFVFNRKVIYKKNDNTFHFYCCDIEIKYLHQLQNLYFALTGEELIFTL